MKRTAAILAAACLLAAPSAAQESGIIRAQASAPGSTMYVISTHLAAVLKERHGYTVEVATGFPGVRSLVNNANYEADLTLYAPALAFLLNNKLAMYGGLEEHAELASRLRVLFTMGTYDQDIRMMADLEGKRVFIGPKGAALVNIVGGLIEAATGLVANEDYELVHVDWPGAPALLQDGAVDVLFQLCAVGCATRTELFTTRPISFVGYTDEMIAKPEFQRQLEFPGRKIKQIMPGT